MNFIHQILCLLRNIIPLNFLIKKEQPSSSQIILRWDIASLTDLEILNTKDKGQDEKLLHQRDREIYLGSAKQTEFVLPDREDQGAMLRFWVEMRRREKEFPNPSPGETIDDIIFWAKYVGFLMSVVMGWMFTWGALAISGKQVNVWCFWLLSVFIPLGFTMLAAWLLIQQPSANGSKRILLNMLVHFLVRIGNLATAGLQRRLKRKHEDWLWTLYANAKLPLYGRKHLFVLLLESLAHFLGLGAIVGIFLAMLTFKTISEPDQGYKMPSQMVALSDARVHSILQALSMPWSWFHGEGEGYPTVEQIMIAKSKNRDASWFHGKLEGYSNEEKILLAKAKKNQDAFAAWSSFLLWSSFVYGVLPRLGLWIAGRICLRRAISSGGYSKFDALWRRMTGAIVVISHPEELQERTDQPVQAKNRSAKPATRTQKRESILLVPGQLNDPEFVESVRLQMQAERLTFEKTEALPSLPKDRTLLVDSLVNGSGNPPNRVLILQEAFMPPNQAFERFIRDGLRKGLGDDVPIHIILLHDTQTPQAAEHLDAWQRRLDRGDPLIQIHTISQETRN